jgi:hypothetical protein
MKLYMLFIAMDLLTLLAYPFVFMYGKLRRFSQAGRALVVESVTPGR